MLGVTAYPAIRGGAVAPQWEDGSRPAAARVAGDSEPLQLEWYLPGTGNWTGEKSLVTADLDADGVDEIVATTLSVPSINGTWFVYDWDGEIYQQIWAASQATPRAGRIRHRSRRDRPRSRSSLRRSPSHECP